MKMLKNIFEKIKRSKNAILLLVITMFLCSCEECPTYQEYLNRGIRGNCLLCGLFDVLTKSASSAADKSWNLFADPLRVIVILATCIYIGFHTLKMIGATGCSELTKGVLIPVVNVLKSGTCKLFLY